MRIYIPMTLPDLAAARERAALGGPPLAAHAVTPAMREWYTSGDLEELEYAALCEAAEASLRLLGADGSAPPRRVVVAADVPDAAVRPDPGSGHRSGVRVGAAVGLDAVVSVHADDADAEAAVAAAREALPAADAGDDDAQFALDEVEAHEFCWYDVTELWHIL